MREKLQRLRVTTEKDMIIVCLPHSSTNLSTLVCLLLSIVMFLLIIATVKRHAANRIERVRLEESRKENSIRLLSFSTLFFYPNPDHRQFSSDYKLTQPLRNLRYVFSLTLPPSCHICIFFFCCSLSPYLFVYSFVYFEVYLAKPYFLLLLPFSFFCSFRFLLFFPTMFTCNTVLLFLSPRSPAPIKEKSDWGSDSGWRDSVESVVCKRG